MSITCHFSAAALAIGFALPMAKPVEAYPIDCAIFLCLAGGWPGSAECNAARAEFIRRITPYPVEPPLQLWRCPMGFPAGYTPPPGSPTISLGPDGLPPEVRKYRDAIEIYHIQHYSRRRVRDQGEVVRDLTSVGRYEADGQFSWVGGSFERGPAWLADAVGGTRFDVQECIGTNRDGHCHRYRVVRTENRAGGGLAGQRPIRGVALRYEDHTGAKRTEFVSY